MSKGMRIALGLATLLPVSVALGGGVAALRVHSLVESGVLPRVPHLGVYLIATVLLMGVLTWTLLAFYIIHASRCDAMTRDRKHRWQVALLLGSMLVMPVYWYKYVWRE